MSAELLFMSAAVGTNRFAETGDFTIPKIAIFNAGEHRGTDYNGLDLAEIIRNFKAVSSGPSPLLDVPCSLGHEPKNPEENWPGQEILDGAGLPAAGWVTAVETDGQTLWARISAVAPEVVDWIQRGLYRHVSAEIYPPGYPHELPVEGYVLRRVAFLGSDVPQVKTLGRIPQPIRNQEPARPVRLRLVGMRANAGGSVLAYSEVGTMADEIVTPQTPQTQQTPQAPTRDDMISKLGEAGFNTSTITPEVPDAVMAEALRCIGGKMDDADQAVKDQQQQVQQVPNGQQPPVPLQQKQDDSTSDGTDLMGEDDRPAKPMDAKSATAFMQYACAKMNEYCGAGDQMDDKVVGQSTMGLVNSTPSPKTEQYSEKLTALEKRIQVTEERTQRAEKFAEERERSARKAACEAEVQALVKSGQVLPSEVDGGLISMIMTLDHQNVLTFSENGKEVKATAFERFMSGLKARPKLMQFAEKVKSSGGGQTDGDQEKAKVEAHYERFSETFKKLGTSKEKFLGAFEKLRQHRPEATASDYLNVNARRKDAAEQG